MTDPATSTAPSALEAFDTLEQRRHYPLSIVARALGLSQGTVRGWADRGDLSTVQVRPGAQRYVPLTELERLASEGWEVNADALLEAD